MSTSKTQQVDLSPDNDYQLTQEVHYDSQEKWLTIIHGGAEITLTLENFEKLKNLVYSAVNSPVGLLTITK